MKFCTKSGVIFVTKSDYMVLEPLEMMCGNSLESFGKVSWKSTPGKD